MQVKKLIDDYGKYLKQTVGVSESTRHQYLRYVKHFLGETFKDTIGDNLGNLKPYELIQHIMKQREHHNVPVIKSLLNALRSFLKFLQIKGLCSPRLVSAVPSIASWKLSKIPGYLTKEQLDKFLASFNRKSPIGRRDYVIALCLARLGLRRKEVTQLTLDDIDWRSGNICITVSKSRRFSSFPLPENVGKAIVDYLRNGRPLTEKRHVFVCHLHRIGEPLSGSAIGAIVRRHFERAGMDVPSIGAHIFRHTVATYMTQQGISIKEVADFLGHRSLDSTVIYTKVNLPMLVEVALPWPEEEDLI